MGSRTCAGYRRACPRYRWFHFKAGLIDKTGAADDCWPVGCPDLIWRAAAIVAELASPELRAALSQPLRELIGSSGSHLVRGGIVNPALLARTLAIRCPVRRNARSPHLLGHGRAVPAKHGKQIRYSVGKAPRCRCFRY